ncbi:Ada metal-binding domain-containing protein [Bisgaard Taxon 10/6]|uniref:DNA-3-methyladenine glycosylase 2 n=1 Tax=Exercitatus varius TaxID=67857 RepID=UPI00294B8D0C|nr:Ada metal-binding domain-containing protein [Exercitatus varius]MDG2916224.1 Ada metal-binding domain-containing protein [Exercitatus varius]MDG2952069.1 Ada metal-binding domain-containing protein [Exercitatus varius]MDG2957398.1 Ada metal-binding domain-containing protein [Exercitatus varius]
MIKSVNSLFRRARLARDPYYDGEFFIAVKSTGIFCRAICPAKLPMEKNVRYFAARETAISAGYRPCYRCKPELISHSRQLLMPIPAVLTEIVSDIRSGILLTQSVHDISVYYGISEDELNWMFMKNFNIPVDLFLEINRALWANNLLFNTNLSAREIVCLCGYETENMMFSAINQYFKYMNKQVETQIELKESNNPEEYIRINIPYPYPYDWHHFLDFQYKRLIKNVEDIHGETYRRNIRFNGRQGFFQITPESGNVFNLQFSRNFLPVMLELINHIKSMFGLDTNITQIERMLSEHFPKLYVAAGLHIPGVFSSFEAGIRAICGQQVSVTAATSLLNQFCDIFLEEDRAGNKYFPLPSNISEAGIAKMRTTNSRKSTLYAFSDWCSKNDIEKNPDDLLSIRGVGKWTVNYIKLRALHDPDVWMGGDLGIKNALTKIGDIDETTASPWRSYLSIHLWNNL